MGCRALLALLVLHLCKVSCLCRCIVQRLGSADISVLAYNFWQATKASLLWGVAPVQVVSHLCHRICALTAICAVASCNGFVWLTASILAWSGAVAPHSAPARTPGVYAQMLYARTHTSGRTKSVQDAPTTNDHDCTDAEPTKHTQPFTTGKGFGVSARMPR
jgi:hypothetical protein